MTSVITEPTATQQALLDMWTENTGTHFLDSGGAYGRNWQRNQGLTVADMLARPPVTLDCRYGYPDITVSAFHWLDDMLEYDPYMQRVYERYDALFTPDEPWLASMERFAERANDESWSGEPINVVNTYNGDSWLDSVLQYVTFTDKHGTPYVMIQYHGGSDVRGGYTKPRVFRINDTEGHYALYTEGRVTLSCSEHYGQPLGDGLFGPVDDVCHGWDSDTSGIEWINYDGSFDNLEFRVMEHDDRELNYVKCPKCDGRLEVSVFFGH